MQDTEYECSEVCRIWYLQWLGQYCRLTVESSGWDAKELSSLTLRVLKNDYITIDDRVTVEVSNSVGLSINVGVDSLLIPTSPPRLL